MAIKSVALLLGRAYTQDDPGESIREIAARLGLQRAATAERVRKALAAGVIRRGVARRNGTLVPVYRSAK